MEDNLEVNLSEIHQHGKPKQFLNTSSIDWKPRLVRTI